MLTARRSASAGRAMRSDAAGLTQKPGCQRPQRTDSRPREGALGIVHCKSIEQGCEQSGADRDGECATASVGRVVFRIADSSRLRFARRVRAAAPVEQGSGKPFDYRHVARCVSTAGVTIRSRACDSEWARKRVQSQSPLPYLRVRRPQPRPAFHTNA